MKLIALFFLILTSSFAYGMELVITSHYDGQVYQDGNGRIDLLGQVNFGPGDNTQGNLGKVTCNDKQGQVQQSSHTWRINYFEILPGNNLISCSYTRNGVTVTKEINFIWEITAEMFIDSPVNGYRFRDEQGRLNLEGHVNFQNPQDVSGNLGKVTCNGKQGQVQGGTFLWKINSFKLPMEGMNLIDCSYTWNGRTTNKPVTIFWSKNNFPPTAQFSMTPESGRAPLEVSFDGSLSNDPDGNIVFHSWNFDDGTTATGVNVNHTFNNPGTYQVALTVLDNENTMTTITKSIVVDVPSQIPVAVATANPSSGEMPLEVTFDASISHDPDGGAIKEYHFDFGDGESIVSTVPYVSHTFTNDGLFNVVVQVKDDEDQLSDSIVLPIQVFRPNLPPVAVIAANETSGQSPLTVEFSGDQSYDTDGTIQSYTWSFPDGTTKTGANVTHTLAGTGPQIVSLTVVDDRNVPGSASITIELMEDADLPVISINPPHNSIIRTSTPQFEINHTDATSGINLGSIRAYLNGQDVSGRLNTAPERSFLTFTQEYPISQGSYELRIELKDNAGNAAVLVHNYQVDLGIIDVAYIVGQVIGEDGAPLENVTIQDIVVPIGLKIKKSTDEEGRFKIPFTIAGAYRFSFSKTGFIETVRTSNPVIVEDIDMGIIKLAESDPVVIPISAASGGVATNSTGTLVVNFEPGDLPSDISFNSKEFTDHETMPGPLPPQSAFTYAFDMRPQGITFGNNGVEVLLDNHLGFPIGSEIVYGYFDRELGRWLDSGRSVPVIATNKTLNGSAAQLNEPFFVTGDPNYPFVCREANSCNPPDGGGSGGGGGGSDGGGGGGCKDGDPCCPGAGGGGGGPGGPGGFGGGGPGGFAGGGPGGFAGTQSSGSYGGGPIPTMGCEISQNSGDLSVSHNTPSLFGGGNSYSLNFRYHSTSVKPHFFAGSELNVFNPQPADYINSSITIAGRTVSAKFVGSGATKKTLYRTLVEAKNADGVDLPTGLYSYTNSLSVAYSDSEYATASYFGGPPRLRLGVLARVPVTFTTQVQEDVPIINRKLSPFGGGWSIGGFERLHVSPSGKVLRDVGSKRTIQYNPTAVVPVLEEKRLLNAKSNYPVKVENLAAFDGVVYGTDCDNNQVYRISLNGDLDVVAGNGERGFSGDGGLANNASLNCPVAVAKAETGGFYIADKDNFKIRRVFQDGTIKTIATHKEKPLSVSEDKMRAVFFTTSSEVMLITPRGKLETYSSETDGYFPVELSNPSQVLFNNEDYPIVVDKNNGRIITLYPQNQSFITLFGKGGFSKTNKNGKIKPKTLTYDPVSHLYYLLDSEGRLYHWDGKGSRELTELALSGNVLKQKKFVKKLENKITAMAYSPETGMIVVSDGQLFMKKKGRTSKNSLMSYTTQKGFTSELTKLENETYEIVDIDKTKRTYNERGYITSIMYPNGKNTFYQYHSNDLLKEIQHFGGVRFYLEYDGRGYLKTVRDSSSRETHFDIDDNGHLLRIESPDGSNKEFTYNSDALLTSERKEDGEFTEFNYVMNKLSSEILPGNRERVFRSISVVGLMPIQLKDSDPAPVVVPADIQSVVDASKSGDCKVKSRVNNMGVMTESMDCLGNATIYTPDENGMFTRIQSPEGRVVNRIFDSKQRLISSQDGAGITTMTYNPSSGKVASIKDSLNYTSYFTYNSLGLLETITDAQGNVSTQSYNSFGNLIMTRDALGNETQLSYDENQNLQMVTDSLGNSVEYTRDAAGNVIQVNDQLNRVTSYEYDNYNQLTAILTPLNYNTYLTYTPRGDIKTHTNASNATTSWDYDSVSFKVSKVINPEGQEERFLYDFNDSLVRKVNKDGTFIDFSYDLKGRLKSRSSASQNNVLSYDKDNLLIFASNSDAAVSMNYNQYGHLVGTESSHAPGKLILTYDDRGLRKTLNYVINGESVLSVAYTHNERKLLSEINATLGGLPVTWQRFWDETGRPETDILSNGLKVQRAYDSTGRLTYLSNEYANGEPLSRFELSYNTTGTVKEILKTFIRPGQTIPGQYVLKYQFDGLDRLTYASSDGNFSYDVMGNHTNRGQVHNNLNHLLEDSDYTYNYTTNGQLSQKLNKITGEKTEYSWSIEGKIIQTTVRNTNDSIKANIISKFDPFSRRIVRISESEEIRYAYADEDIIVEFGNNDSIRAIYLHGPGIDEPIAMVRDVNQNGSFEAKEIFFYSKDHLSSVHDLTDYQGKPVQRYNYTAYGKTRIEKTNQDQQAKLVQNIYAYTSREWEQETGDYYYRARFYDPKSGRFLSEDPIGLSGGDDNLYRYVSNNPIKFNDPLGLKTETCWAIEGTFPHNYICVDGVCDGLGPDEPGGITDTVPGGHQGGPSSSEPGSFCREIPTKNDEHEKCIDSCARNTLTGGRPPYTAFPTPGGGAQNCAGYVADTISNCLKQCASKALSSGK